MGPVRRRRFIDGGAKIVANRRSERVFITAIDLDQLDQWRPVFTFIGGEDTAQRFTLRIELGQALLGLEDVLLVMEGNTRRDASFSSAWARSSSAR